MAFRKAAFVFLVVCLLLVISVPDARVQQKFVYQIKLSDEIINPVAVEYIESAVTKAQVDGAAALVIELDTPGGLLSSTRRIVKTIMNAQVPVIVYVAPSGARAGSAGVFITLAAHVAAMAPSTNIGAAHPVSLEDKRSTSDAWRDLIKEIVKEKNKEREPDSQNSEKQKSEKREVEVVEPMEDKILNDAKAWARSIAEFRGKNADWAEKAVSESVSATENEAVENRIVDFVAENTQDVLAKAEGRPAMMPGGTKEIETKGAQIVEIPMSTRLKWLSVLAHPNIAYILLMLGFYGLLFEFTHPGVAFPGIAGAICLVLAFFGLQVLPTNFAGVALIVLGIIFFIAEIKVTSYGLLTIGGLVSLFFGSLILFASPYEYMRVSLPLVFAFVGATFIIAAGLTTLVIRLHRRRPKTGIEGLIGETGVVKSVEDGRIRVFVHGELWEAECDLPLKVGDEVEVVKVVGMKLIVR